MMPEFFSKIWEFIKNVWQGFKLLPKIRKGDLPALLESFNKRNRILIAVLSIVMLVSGGFLIFQNSYYFGSGPHYIGSYSEGLLGQPQFINPVMASGSSVDMDLSRIIYAQLLKFDKNGNLTPELAEKLPEISADLKTYTLKLKPNLSWQDGKTITADDVIFTIQTIQNAEYDSPLATNWNKVKVDKLDDLTVSIKLREVSVSFITNFALGIIPKHIWENLSPQKFRLSEYNLSPIGSGPFIMDKIKKTSDGTVKSISLKVNKKYFAGRAFLDNIIFYFYTDYDSLLQAYQSHEINGLGFIPFDKKAFLDVSDKYNQYEINLPQYRAVFFNLRNPILSDKAVRQALWLTTDRKQIIDQAYFGFAPEAYGPILSDKIGYSPEIEKITHINVSEAIDILNKGGWILDPTTNLRVKDSAKGGSASGGKKTLEFNLATNDFILNLKTAQILQSQWTELGIRVNLVIVSSQELSQQYIRPRSFDALLFSENTGADPDPFSFWHSSQTRDPGLNLSGFANASADKLITDARQTADANIRIKNYQQFQTIITNELPAIFLNRSIFVYNVPKKIKGVEINSIVYPSDRFTDIAHWYLGN